MSLKSEKQDEPEGGNTQESKPLSKLEDVIIKILVLSNQSSYTLTLTHRNKGPEWQGVEWEDGGEK